MTRNGHARLCQNISKKREYFTQIVFVLKCVSLWIFFFTSPTVFSALLDLVLCLFKLLKLEKVRKKSALPEKGLGHVMKMFLLEQPLDWEI